MMKKIILASAFVFGASFALSAQTTKSCGSEHGTKSCCSKNTTSVSTGTSTTTSTTTTKSCCMKGGDHHSSTTTTDGPKVSVAQARSSALKTATTGTVATTEGK